jgi:hypothetical protein
LAALSLGRRIAELAKMENNYKRLAEKAGLSHLSELDPSQSYAQAKILHKKSCKQGRERQAIMNRKKVCTY